MIREERYKITSNDYADIIIQYNGSEAVLQRYQTETIQIIDVRYAVVYYPASQITIQGINQLGYASIPTCLGLENKRSLEVSGINRIRETPAFGLRGQGVLVGIADTGIDYTNPVFLHKDGTSKIVSIWDQTIDSEDRYPDYTFYGTVYDAEQINLALANEDPYSVVPSRDENGHGTILAGIAAGSEDEANNFSGVVPDSDLVIVKLKEAKPVLKTLHALPQDIPCYQENDMIWGVKYLVDTANRLGRPLAICIGMGTSQGSHDGVGILSAILSIIGEFPGVAVVISAGNEGSSKRHYFNTISPTVAFTTVELNIGENENDFAMEIRGEAPNSYSIDITSPGGEFVPRIAESLRSDKEIAFLFENTHITVNYMLVEPLTGEPLIMLRFRNPAPGIWRFRVYSRGDLPGSFHIWLPMGRFITLGTYFIQPNPYTTVTAPSNSFVPIAVTAYNQANNSLLQSSSKGFTKSNIVKPELAAPGVNILSPTLDHGYAESSGTGAAAAHMTGIAAMMMEWGIVRGNYPGMASKEVKKFLIRGAKRSANILYPNRDWGYGIVDIYNAFAFIRGAI